MVIRRAQYTFYHSYTLQKHQPPQMDYTQHMQHIHGGREHNKLKYIFHMSTKRQTSSATTTEFKLLSKNAIYRPTLQFFSAKYVPGVETNTK